MTSLPKSDIFSRLPVEWPFDLMPDIQANLHSSGRKIIVLDDDPTGTQTVHHVPVLTRWSVASLVEEFALPSPVFYLLTNSRGLQPEEAATLGYEIGASLRMAAAHANQPFSLISRSDSTLRGHFPAEVTALAKGLGEEFDATLIVPYFREGGRFTINDVHYVTHGDRLIPAGETEFARDVTFGYRSSNLRQWVQEKTGGLVSSGDVRSISLETIRASGPDQVFKDLFALENGKFCVVNAASDRDLEVLTLAIQRAESLGKRFLCRTAASFVRVRAGLLAQDLLEQEFLPITGSEGGLVIVGSHVPRSTAQLNKLRQSQKMVEFELSVPGLLDSRDHSIWIDRYLTDVSDAIQSGKDVLLYTSRDLVEGNNGRESLGISQVVSTGLVRFVKGLRVRPRFILAKGGITSSDIATHGLGVQRAIVLGQILPGVPVWQLGPESKFPGLTYIVFPGNVGDESALWEAVQRLSPRN